MRGGSEYKFQVKERPGKGPSSGPVYLCVGNDALAELVEATPAERRKDLVCVCVCVCERERERQRERERDRERLNPSPPPAGRQSLAAAGGRTVKELALAGLPPPPPPPPQWALELGGRALIAALRSNVPAFCRKAEKGGGGN